MCLCIEYKDTQMRGCLDVLGAQRGRCRQPNKVHIRMHSKNLNLNRTDANSKPDIVGAGAEEAGRSLVMPTRAMSNTLEPSNRNTPRDMY